MSEYHRERTPSGGARSRQTGKKRKSRRSVGATIAIRFFQLIGTLLLIAVVTGSIMACYAAVYIKNAIIPNATLDLAAYTLNENSVIYYYDDDGVPVEWVTLVGKENREWVDFEDIPKDLVDAFIAIEDKRFWEHQGVDWYRTVSAFANMFLSMRDTYGASTITQQLVKNMTEYDDVTVSRKIQEIFTALDVEKNYKKEEILEQYLNWIYFGNGCYGVQSAAEFYFNKKVSELTLAECASLAGITNNPSMYAPNAALSVTRYPCAGCGAYSLSADEKCPYCGETHYGAAQIWTGREYNKHRQQIILGQMADPKISENGPYITQAEYDAAVKEKLIFRWDVQNVEEDEEEEEDVTIYPWYVDAVISEVVADLKESTGLSTEVVTNMVYSGGLKIYVPYDPDVQADVDQIYNDRENLPYTSKTGQKMSSAITVVDNATGYVVAIAGDVGGKDVNRAWNNALANQQPGSSIKPLSVYSPALEMGLITPATIVDDNPLELDGKAWPLNAPRGYRGLTTVQSAVERSVNTVAVQVLQRVTPQIAYEFMTQRYGITTLEGGRWENNQYKSDIDLSPLSMGGLTDGVSTFEMAAAYATFPRNGAHTEATTYLRIEDIDGRLLLNNEPETTYVIKASTAYYVNSVLTAAVTSGTGTKAKISGQVVAGKTGTTNSVYDLWFAGYTPYYTAVVWTGYPYDEYMTQFAQGGNPSVTLWQKVMALVHEGLEKQEFLEPENLVSCNVCKDCGLLATGDCSNDLRGNRVQTFRLVRGDAPTEYCTCHVQVTICTECPILDANGNETGAYHIATAFCPVDSVKEVTMVDYTRTLVNEEVVVTDYYALMSVYDGLEDANCTVHAPWWGDIDWPWESDPGGDDPTPGGTEDPDVSSTPEVTPGGGETPSPEDTQAPELTPPPAGSTAPDEEEDPASDDGDEDSP